MLEDWNVAPLRHRLPLGAFSLLWPLLAFSAAGQQIPAAAQTPARTDAQRRAHTEEALKAVTGGAPIHRIGTVAISPDGANVAFVHETKDGSELVVAPYSDLAKMTRVSAIKKGDGKCMEWMPDWAPDSKRLVFKGNCPSGAQNNLYLATIGGDLAESKRKFEVTRLTEAKGEVGDPIFSPDGSKVGFLYVEGATRSAGALDAMKPWSGVIGEDGIEVQRVAMVDAGAKKPAVPVMATPAQVHVYEFDWSPDSKAMTYVAADPPGENNWWVAKLYTQEIDGQPKVVFAPSESAGAMHGLQIAVPRWSPDGKTIAFIGGLMSDQGSTGGDVWMVPASGGEAQDLTPASPASPAWIQWSDSSHLFVSELASGKNQLVRMAITGDGTAKPDAPIYSFAGTAGDDRLELSLSSTKDRSTFLFTASSFDRAPEMYSVSATAGSKPITQISGLRQLTHFNDGAQPLGGKTDSLEWSTDGFHVQGWLHYPKGYDAARKYPMLVLVHGGPAAAAQSQWGSRGLSASIFAAMGYFVLEPNPRGSYGQGEAFAAANRKDFGYGDLRDILGGLDAAVATASIDSNRVGLLGWSYGGFMTMFGVTQTNRFKAAVAGAGISDWLSYYGENSIDQWMTPYFGASVYEDPAVYARSSAINFISKAKTPTLVVVGDRDGECPAPQSFEFWHALRDQHVPTQLVVYPNEGHGFSNPEHRTDVLVRALDWFEKYMPEKPGSGNTD